MNDYEGISGHEEFHDDLTLMYFPTIESDTGNLHHLEMVPLQIRKMSLRHPPPADIAQLHEVLRRESVKFRTVIGFRDGVLYVE